MKSMKEIHGHAVMEMMVASGKLYTKESLKEDIIKEFGNDATYHTCSAQGMTADELIDLLKSKGKFIEQSNGFKTDEARICKH
jgi:probable metal-binding protein